MPWFAESRKGRSNHARWGWDVVAAKTPQTTAPGYWLLRFRAEPARSDSWPVRPDPPAPGHYFIDGMTMPFMMMRLANRNTINGGMLTRTVAARM